ncbi:MAG TPA: hypothetical protein PK054_08805 [Anaerohalosphaeraceae bacterium]|nr:hypothetical protein [Anaerohalosphaeraceae bacterium]HOL88257.1 hypothetical protein [Anaerohalosphaeraceae bacterium]HPP56667.1 hypothetical protein [Anaerohalosphaeraceae bacterium]
MKANRRHLYFFEILICFLSSVLGGILLSSLSWYLLGLGDRSDVLLGLILGMPLGGW